MRTANEVRLSLVGSGMCIRDSDNTSPAHDTSLAPGDTSPANDTTLGPGGTSPAHDTSLGPGDTSPAHDTSFGPGGPSPEHERSLGPGDPSPADDQVFITIGRRTTISTYTPKDILPRDTTNSTRAK